MNCRRRRPPIQRSWFAARLATSGAAVATVKAAGAQSVRLIAIIAAPEGIDRLQGEHPDVAIVVAAIDRGLNEKGYILPGLGDAGDRLYGVV